MIAEAEIRRYAAQWGVDPMVADLDYALGWFLAALYGTARSANLLLDACQRTVPNSSKIGNGD